MYLLHACPHLYASIHILNRIVLHLNRTFLHFTNQSAHTSVSVSYDFEIKLKTAASNLCCLFLWTGGWTQLTTEFLIKRFFRLAVTLELCSSLWWPWCNVNSALTPMLALCEPRVCFQMSCGSRFSLCILQIAWKQSRAARNGMTLKQSMPLEHFKCRFSQHALT